MEAGTVSVCKVSYGERERIAHMAIVRQIYIKTNCPEMHLAVIGLSRLWQFIPVLGRCGVQDISSGGQPLQHVFSALAPLLGGHSTGMLHAFRRRQGL